MQRVPGPDLVRPRGLEPARARELQIPVDGTARIDRRRSYTDIAAQLGVTDMTVVAAARRHHIPSSPPGVQVLDEPAAAASR